MSGSQSIENFILLPFEHTHTHTQRPMMARLALGAAKGDICSVPALDLGAPSRRQSLPFARTTYPAGVCLCENVTPFKGEREGLQVGHIQPRWKAIVREKSEREGDSRPEVIRFSIDWTDLITVSR